MPASIVLKDESSVPTPASGYTAIRANEGALYTKDDTGTERKFMPPRLGTYTASDASPSVAGLTALQITNASPTTITAFDGGIEGQILVLRFTDANTTIQAAALNLPADYVSSAGAMLMIVRFSDGWYTL